MALEKTESLRHEVEPNGTVFVVTKSVITDDGAVVGASGNHRKPISPGDDYSGEAAETKAICDAVQTESVVSAYAAAQAPAAPAAEEAPAEESE
jgi:hypothetical protein